MGRRRGSSSRGFGNVKWPFIASAPSFTLAGVVLTDRILFMSQIELFDFYTVSK